jgi:hypothetical protein
MKTTTWLTLLALASLVVVPVSAAAETAVRQDLAAVIALNGHPCGQVVTVQRLGENDYLASCSNGLRYRVSLRGDRVVVQKQ